jgi:hypothetical protein
MPRVLAPWSNQPTMAGVFEGELVMVIIGTRDENIASENRIRVSLDV